MNLVDTTSHISLLNPESIADPIHVIGCGAVGSQIAYSLAKLGFDNIHLWDFDKVESHNVANQLYGVNHAGQFKVEALAQILDDLTGITAITHTEKCEHDLDGYIFLAVDSMEARRAIFNKNWMRPSVHYIVECRMNPWDGQVWAVNPKAIAQVKRWQSESAYLDDDTSVERSPCGRNLSVGPTARIMAEIAVMQFMRWCRFQQKLDGAYPVETVVAIGMNQFFIETRQ